MMTTSEDDLKYNYKKQKRYCEEEKKMLRGGRF